MHAIAEIVIPPTADVKTSIAEVMEYFCPERGQADWWDFWIIGGRFSGHKLEATLDRNRLEAFYAVLKERKVTVSSFTCGKQDLDPPSQIPMVDALWREMFPGNGDRCWLFNHARDQYAKSGHYQDDVCKVADVPEKLNCERLIVAGPHWKDKAHVEPKRMLATEFWNRVEHQKTAFDGLVKPVLDGILSGSDTYHANKMIGLQPDWLVVTVDYHN